MRRIASLGILILCLFSVTSLFSSSAVSANTNESQPMTEGDYRLVIDGFDWGPTVSQVILSLDEAVSSADMQQYQVMAERSTDLTDIKGTAAKGEREILHAYVSDAKGNWQKTGTHITLVLLVAPNLPISSPIQYIRKDGRGSNYWIDYKLTITHTASNQIWDKETGRIRPLIDDFDLTGSYTHQDGLSMSYASYQPKETTGKSPLIIWLHGGGEGGTDPSIPLIANRAANYASEEIQAYFGGAYVLAPQSPTFWMQNAEGTYTRGKEDDIYNAALMALIKAYVAKHPDIDQNRIYVGGCSNGGYMSLKLILLYPEYFAAGYISALAYHSEYLTDAQLKSIKEVPIWFIQSKDDPVTLPEKTVVPVYQRLRATGAKDVHFTFYDHVVDLTGFYGGDNYRFNGHWSWIYSHANHSKLDYDGSPVMLEGRAVTIMEWMAAQSR